MGHPPLERNAVMDNPKSNAFRIFPVRIPKGFCPKAQGCDEGATLGKSADDHEPQRGCGLSGFISHHELSKGSNPKTECRNPKPKEIRRTKSEARNPKAEGRISRFLRELAIGFPAWRALTFGFRMSGFFRISGIRVSDFGLRLLPTTALVAGLLLLMLAAPALAQTNEQRSLILVIGASGTPEYGAQFSQWGEEWKHAAAKGGLQTFVIGEDQDHPTNDRTRLLTVLTNEAAKPAGELWLVFLGHGTFDGRVAKFNLRGPDLAAGDLAAALKPCQRPLAIVQCASASGPFINALSGTNRVIITATRSGYEVNATRFGEYLAKAIADPAADLDKDGQTSLLEAFLLASREVAQFYKEAGRLATEHPLLDDNGDGLGTPADWFRGVRAVKTAANGKSVDGVRAHQLHLVRGESEQELSPAARGRRDELEKQLSELRLRKDALQEDEYYRQLEDILVNLARLYQNK